MTEAILESISDGVFTVDLDWRITYFNQAAAVITGVPKEQAVGQLCSEVFKSNKCERDCPLRQTLRTRTPLINRPGCLIRGDGQRVPISVSTAIMTDEQGRITGGAETFRDLSEIEDLRQQLQGKSSFGSLISSSPAMVRLIQTLPAYAESLSTILIQGETGTGKEVLARALHEASSRAEGPFVAVNCGALPDNLLESELFGYRKGAFTGAERDKPGRFATAEDGTLFLDELGEISPAMQVKLLRVLQEHEYEPLGANHPQKTNARVITATNRDLGVLVSEGKFRLDLFYRINVLMLTMPPLRNRPEDIPVLAEAFLTRFNQRMGKQIRGISEETLDLLAAHSWPGNIRELENVIERSVVVCSSDEILPHHLPGEFSNSPPERKNGAETIRQAREEAERQSILQALFQHRNHRGEAARALGVDKSTLYRRAAALGLELPGQDGRSREK